MTVDLASAGTLSVEFVNRFCSAVQCQALILLDLLQAAVSLLFRLKLKESVDFVWEIWSTGNGDHSVSAMGVEMLDRKKDVTHPGWT